MNFKRFCILAAALALLASGEVRAAAIYYNVDNVTLPGGPIQLQGGAISAYDSVNKQYTISGNAVNLGTQPFGDVLLLDQWVFEDSPATAFTFNNVTDTWSGNSHTLKVDAPNGFVSMSQVSPGPLSWTHGSTTATLMSSDAPPFIDIGPIGPNGSVPFSFKIDVDSNFSPVLDASFISLTQPVPEPSTLVMAALAAGGLVYFGARRRSILKCRI